MAVMLENVPGLSQARFAGYREQVLASCTTWAMRPTGRY